MSLEDLLFRPMQAEDSLAVAEMSKALYQSLGAPAAYVTDEKIMATFRQLSIQPQHLQLEVFVLKEQLVGYALLFKFWYNEYGGMVLNIDEIFVKPGFRSLGISSRYLDALARRKDGHVALSLEVLPENKRAYSLYKRTGFEEKETVTLHKILE